MPRPNSIFLVYVTAWLLSISGAASATISLGSSSPSFQIGNGVQFFEDPGLSHTIESIRTTHIPWNTYHQDVFNAGYSKSNWWLKFELVNKGTDQQSYIMEVDYPVLDYIDVYFEENQQITTYHEMGDKLPFEQRPVQHRLFLVPFTMAPQSQKIVYIRLNSSSSIQAPITIWNPENYHEADVLTGLVHGVYIGGMLIIGIYNLLIFIALRDKIYLFYVAYVFSMLLFLSSLNGWAFHYLWPQSTQWNDLAILIFLNSVVLFTVTFAERFLALKKLGHTFRIQTNIWVVISMLGFLFYLTAPYNVSIKILIPCAALACLWTLSMSIYAWFKGQRSAGIYIISWTGILVGGVLLAMNKLHLIPRNVFTDQSVQLGSLLEVMLLSFALAERINDERHKRFQAQNEALAAQTLAKEKLETSVAERTKELKIANKRLQELSDTDQLTGLKNRRYLDQFIEHERIRATRYKHPLSILLIDIDHFKQLNDTHGHLAGDACLKEIASCFAMHMRVPIDLCARYGGEEFCVVLPETNLEGALLVAERIRKTINDKTFDASGISLTLSVSIGAYSKIPKASDTSACFVDKADTALYRAKQNGRNQVQSS